MADANHLFCDSPDIHIYLNDLELYGIQKKNNVIGVKTESNYKKNNKLYAHPNFQGKEVYSHLELFY